MHNIRLEKESIINKQSEGGKKGARIRYGSPSELPINTPTHILDKDRELDIEKEDRDRVIKSFHAICKSLPSIRKLSKKRLSALNARLKEYPEEQFWTTYFEKVERSDFLSGRKDSWRTGIDWLLNENNMIKVLEGNYDNKKSGSIMDAARELQQEMGQ